MLILEISNFIANAKSEFRVCVGFIPPRYSLYAVTNKEVQVGQIICQKPKN